MHCCLMFRQIFTSLKLSFSSCVSIVTVEKVQIGQEEPAYLEVTREQAGPQCHHEKQLRNIDLDHMALLSISIPSGSCSSAKWAL